MEYKTKYNASYKKENFKLQKQKCLWKIARSSTIRNEILCKSPSVVDCEIERWSQSSPTCAAHKSMPDIETNVRPILSDIATPKVIDGPRYSISAKVRTPLCLLPVAGTHFRSRIPWRDLLCHPTSISFSDKNLRTLPFLLSHPECMTRNPGPAETYPRKFSVISDRTLASRETGKKWTAINKCQKRQNPETNDLVSSQSHLFLLMFVIFMRLTYIFIKYICYMLPYIS